MCTDPAVCDGRADFLAGENKRPFLFSHITPKLFGINMLWDGIFLAVQKAVIGRLYI